MTVLGLLACLWQARVDAHVPSSANEMLRAFDRTVDGPEDPDEAKRYRIVDGERHCGWSCDPSGPYYEQDKHMCPAECKPGYIAPPRTRKRKREKILDVCATSPPPLPKRTGRVSCGNVTAASFAAAGYWMLIGVQTGPGHLGRREGVRNSWKRWEQDPETPGVLVCFLIGRVGIQPSMLPSLEAESAKHGDVLWLENATDAGVPTIKGYHWWRSAAKLLPPGAQERHGPCAAV